MAGMRILLALAVALFLLPWTAAAITDAHEPDQYSGWQRGESWNGRSDFWRQAREGSEGTASQPSRGVLIQRHGADWRMIHTGLVSTYGQQLVLLTVGSLVALLLLMNRRLRALAAGLAGQIRRLGSIDRLAYWLTAASFLTLGTTGLVILYGRRMLAPFLGRDAFAQIAWWSKAIHDNTSWAFMLGVLLLVLVWIRDHVPQAGRLLKSAAAERTMPSITPLSATEKLAFWSVVGGGLVVSYSGLALLFPLAFAEMQRMQLMQIVHSLSSMTLATLIFGHVFIATMSIRENARKLFEAKEVLEQRVDERTRELEVARARAEEANRTKDRFLATASHDLLQPLSAARLMIATLRQRQLEAANSELIDRVHVALTGAEDLLADLLDISRMDAGGMTPRIEAVAAATLLDTMAAEFTPGARMHGLEFRVMPCRLMVATDPHLLGRVLRNLVTNAIRYTHSGTVLLGCRRQGRSLRFEVWDTGIGIAPDHLGKIFEEFHRESHRAGIQRGAGLGLAIVERIAQVLDAAITVRSEPGRGSMFAVTVPLSDAVPEAMAPTEVDDDLAGLRVMVVDNEEDVLLGMTRLLEEWGCVVLPASSPEEALEAAQEHGFAPALVLADFHLDDGVLGIDFAAEAQRRLGGVPTVIITADRTPEVAARIAAAELHLLHKPIKPAKLRALISHLTLSVAA